MDRFECSMGSRLFAVVFLFFIIINVLVHLTLTSILVVAEEQTYCGYQVSVMLRSNRVSYHRLHAHGMYNTLDWGRTFSTRQSSSVALY